VAILELQGERMLSQGYTGLLLIGPQGNVEKKARDNDSLWILSGLPYQE